MKIIKNINVEVEVEVDVTAEEFLRKMLDLADDDLIPRRAFALDTALKVVEKITPDIIRQINPNALTSSVLSTVRNKLRLWIEATALEAQ